MNQRSSASQTLLRRLIPGLLLGFLVLVALAFLGDLRQVGAQVRAFDWRIYPLVIGFTLLNYLLRFFKWQFFLGQIGVVGLPWRESARLYVAGFPLAVTPGKVGEALKGLWLNQKTGISTPRGVSVVLAERISDGLGMLGLSVLGVIVYPGYWPAFAFVFIALMGVIVITLIRPLAESLLRLGERLPLVNRFIHALHEFYEGSYALFRPKVVIVAVGLGVLSWLEEGIGLYLILLGLGHPPGWEALFVSIFTLSFSIIIGALSALPGGLGAAEATLAGMLVLLLGLEASSAAAATLLIRLATLWFGVALGLLTWAFSRDLLGLASSKPD